MPYKTRNILVLAALLLIVAVVGGYWGWIYYPHKRQAVQKKIEQLQHNIAALDNIETEYLNLEKLIEEQKRKLSRLDKKIRPAVSPAQSYRYLNNILNYSGMLQFDMYFNGKKTANGYSYNVYRIKGEGSFQRIYRFVRYLEKGPEFYKINKLGLRMVESKDPHDGLTHVVVPFEMELWALYADVSDLPPIRRTLRDVRARPVLNPFYPYILKNIPVNKYNLVEVERATLRAVMPGKAIVADNNGRIHVLKEGDRVYLGYVNRIDLAHNAVEFLLNKGGLLDKFTLRLQFNENDKIN